MFVLSMCSLPPSAGRRIVVACDPDPDTRDILATVLKATGYEARVVPDGDAALPVAIDPDVGLLITNLYVRCARGHCLAATVKRDPALAHVPVLVYSAHVLDHDQEWARELGADSFLPKPQRVERVLTVVRDLLARGVLGSLVRHTTTQDTSGPHSPDRTTVSETISREFTDAVGVRWTARLVVPMSMSATFERVRELHARVAGRPAAERRSPWLVFESSEGEKRRLSPAPEKWATCSAFELERWCMRAVLVPPGPARRAEDK